MVPRALSTGRRAFTLVELLVVIAIIGILVALLLPAVQAAREAARRSQCGNNLKQIGLAIHEYHDVHKAYPISYGTADTVGSQYNMNNTGKSWIVGILPFMEQAPLHSRIQFNVPLNYLDTTTNTNPNTLVAMTVIETLLCPSDGANQKGLMGGRANSSAVTPSNPSNLWGVNNYKGVSGGNWNDGNFTNVFQPNGKVGNSNAGLDHGNGWVCRNGSVAGTTNCMRQFINVSSVIDGTSNTFFVGEAVPAWCTHTWWWWFNGSTATCAIPLNYRRNLGTGFLVANAGNWQNNYSFFSQHPGGGQFALGDASARFIANSIDLTLYRQLATINGDEPGQVP